MTRHGKIARLPKAIRDELNRRLADGEHGKRLVVWLNGLAEVRAILEADFEGKAISPANLTQWKQGGYQEWQQKIEVTELARELRERPQGIKEALEGGEASDYLGTLMMVQLAQISQTFLDKNLSVEERWKRFRTVNMELARMRLGDHRKRMRDIWMHNVSDADTNLSGFKSI